MSHISSIQVLPETQTFVKKHRYFWPPFFSGLLIPFGLAPFHLPGMAILGVSLFFILLQNISFNKAVFTGFAFGVGCLGLGVSWVYVSIHEYGHLNSFVSAAITLLFIFYLAAWLAIIAGAYQTLSQQRSLLFNCLLFSVLWCVGEYLRSTVLGGFPWLLLGFGQVDTPIKYTLPFLGIYGASFFASLSAAFLGAGILTKSLKRIKWLGAFIAILILPALLKNIVFDLERGNQITVGVVQANMSMRDKWDEELFWKLLQHYQDAAEHLIKSNNLVIMPESAIPVPSHYISDFLEFLDSKANEYGSSVLLGTLQQSDLDDTKLYNAMIAIGNAQGIYQKQHLVPFGEYIPKPLQRLIEWMALPAANMSPGKMNQPLVFIQNHPIASLICYELAYPDLLRKQLPLAEWIVSISDDGWFGHSFAMYQQLQMAQALSMQTARYQIIANNDGLSSVIDSRGRLIKSLAPYTSGLLESYVRPINGLTPWVFWGDNPMLLFFSLVLLSAFYLKKKNKY